MQTHENVVKRIYEAQGLTGPDGRIVARYHVSDAHYDELYAFLLKQAPWDSVARILMDPWPAAFCIYAAEAWRRRFANSAWTWDTIPLSIQLDGPMRNRVISAGLRALKRPPVPVSEDRHQYLGAIACEAGIPPQVLSKEGARLRRFMRSIIEQLAGSFEGGVERATFVAYELREMLPIRLRQDSFLRLSAEIAGAACQVGSRLGSTVDAASLTTARLDTILPGWRDLFPLRLDDETALSLVSGLVSEAMTVTRNIPFRIETLYVDGPPRLVRVLECPATIKGDGLGSLLEQTLDPGTSSPDPLPPRMDILHWADSGPRLLASLSQSSLAPPTWRIEFDGARRLDAWPLQSKPEDHPAVALPERITFALRARGQILSRFVPPGGASPQADLPWVFAPPRADEPMVLVGTGSVRVASWRDVVVLLPPGAVIVEDRLPIEAGPGDRGLVRISASDDDPVVIRIENEVFWIRRGEQSVRLDAHFVGSTVPGFVVLPGEHPVFRAPPRLRVVDAYGLTREIGSERLHHRDGRGLVRSLSESRPIGRAMVSWSEDGDLRFRKLVYVLPVGVDMAIEAVSATRATFRISMRHMPSAAPSVSALDPRLEITPQSAASRSISSSSAGFKFEYAIDAPSEVHHCKMRVFIGGAVFDLETRFPRVGAGFFDMEDQLLSQGAVVSRPNMWRVRAEQHVTSHQADYQFHVLARLRDRDVVDEWRILSGLTFRRAGLYATDFSGIERNIDRLLALADSATAELEVMLTDSRGSVSARNPTVRIGRFSGTFQHVPKSFPSRYACDLADQVVVKALRIEAPDAPLVVLPFNSDGLTVTPADHLAPGAWMLLGVSPRDDRQVTICPVLAIVTSTHVGSTTDEASHPLLDAINTIEFADRAKRFDTVLPEMGRDAAHPSWPLLMKYLNQLTWLSPGLFESTRYLYRHPQTLALALLKCDEPARVLRSYDTLPFAQATWPVAALTKAIETFVDTEPHALRDLPLGPDELDLLLEGALKPNITRFAKVLFNRMPGFEAACLHASVRTWAMKALIAELQDIPSLRVMASSPAIVEHYARGIIMALRQRQPDPDLWPALQKLDALDADLPALAKLVRNEPPECHAILLAPLKAARAMLSDKILGRVVALEIRQAEAFDGEYFREMHRLAILALPA